MFALSSGVFELAMLVRFGMAVAVVAVGFAESSQCTVVAVAGSETLLAVNSLYTVAVRVRFQSQWLEEQDRVAVGLAGDLRTNAARTEAGQGELCCQRRDRSWNWSTSLSQLLQTRDRVRGA